MTNERSKAVGVAWAVGPGERPQGAILVCKEIAIFFTKISIFLRKTKKNARFFMFFGQNSVEYGVMSVEHTWQPKLGKMQRNCTFFREIAEKRA